MVAIPIDFLNGHKKCNHRRGCSSSSNESSSPRSRSLYCGGCGCGWICFDGGTFISANSIVLEGVCASGCDDAARQIDDVTSRSLLSTLDLATAILSPSENAMCIVIGDNRIATVALADCDRSYGTGGIGTPIGDALGRYAQKEEGEDHQTKKRKNHFPFLNCWISRSIATFKKFRLLYFVYVVWYLYIASWLLCIILCVWIRIGKRTSTVIKYDALTRESGEQRAGWRGRY